MFRRHYSAIGLVIILFLLPIALGSRSHVMHILVLCLIWAVIAAAWDLIMGYASIYSYGQIAFLIIGGYTTAMLTIYARISPWLGMLAGGLAAGLAGILIGLPCLRLKGVYVCVVTLCLHWFLEPVIVWGDRFRLSTRGSFGLYPPPLKLAGYTFSTVELVPSYYLALIIFLVGLFVIYKVIHSWVGRAFIALRDSETFAKSVGIDEYKYKLLVFGISALITGVMGAFYTHFLGAISPRVLGIDLFLIALVMVLVGGLGRFPGAAAGAFFVIFLDDLLRPTGTLRYVILGSIVIAVVIFMPRGLMVIPEYLGRMVSKRAEN